LGDEWRISLTFREIEESSWDPIRATYEPKFISPIRASNEPKFISPIHAIYEPKFISPIHAINVHIYKY
jgi:hypothetical protein